MFCFNTEVNIYLLEARKRLQDVINAAITFTFMYEPLQVNNNHKDFDTAQL